MAGEHVLLVLSKYRACSEAVDYALDRAAATAGRLTVALVVLSHEAERLVECLADQGFLGQDVSRQVKEEVLREDESVGKKTLHQILEEARRRGLAAESVTLAGPLAEVVPHWARGHGVDRIVITRADRGNLHRRLFGSEVSELKRTPAAPVEVFLACGQREEEDD